MLDTTKIPAHVAIIMDGNRRWAKKRGLPSIAGHREAVDKTVENLIEVAGELGIKYLTLWAFSTENWGREQEEVKGLMNLFRLALATKVKRFIEKGARLNYIGDIGRFDDDLREGMEKARKASEKNDKITVTFALNYGGKDEILRGVRKILNEKIQKGTNADELTIEELGKNMDTANLPDPDLIIRTGGERRTSGFLLWSGAYAEWYFADTLFPDFGKKELEAAIEDYQARQRRFGK